MNSKLKEISVSQVWLITGSSRGLGRALAETVLGAGHKLVATARNPAQLTDLVRRYRDQVRAVALDVTDERAAGSALHTALEAFGRLDVLVNRPPGRAAYAAAKWGVEGFSEVLAKEVGPLGIKVTIIEPGGFREAFDAPFGSR